MKKKILLAVIMFVAATWVLFRIVNYFHHFNHTGGIAYYKPGFIPFLPIETTAGEMPFTVTGGTLSAAAVGKQIIIHIGNSDSIDVLYLTGITEHLVHQKFGETISNPFFSIVIKRNNNPLPPAKHNAYIIKFVSEVPVNHAGGIGYFVQSKIPYLIYDITDNPPFRVTITQSSDYIQYVPVYFKLISQEKYYFTYSINGHDREYTCRFGSTISTAYFTINVQPTHAFTNDDFSKIYYIKYERAHAIVEHVDGIGYFTEADMDISNTAPFKVTIKRKTDSVLNVPVSIRYYADNNGPIFFYYQVGAVNGGNGIYGTGQFDKPIETPALSFTAQPTSYFAKDGNTHSYYFKIER